MEFSPRAAELTTLLESRMTNFYTNFQVDEILGHFLTGIMDLHHDIFFFLILIFVFVSWVLVRALWHFHEQKNPIPKRIVHGTTIEILWTIFPSIIPMFIAIPSFVLFYSMDEVVVDPAITIKAIGHQWYNSSDEQSLTFDSYTIPEDDPELGQSRLLEVDNRVVVPAKTHLRMIVTPADVPHSWAVTIRPPISLMEAGGPSMGAGAGSSAPSGGIPYLPGNPPAAGGDGSDPDKEFEEFLSNLSPLEDMVLSPVPTAESSSAPSALDQKKDFLILKNLEERKGALGAGQEVPEVRQAVEEDFNVHTKGQEFLLIQQLEKEVNAKKLPSPATNCAFNKIKEHEGKIQDGKGGGRPNDCANQKKIED